MSSWHPQRLLRFLLSDQSLLVLLGIGLTIFAVALIILLYTRWGQYRPLRKCMVLSVLAHCLLAGYVTTMEMLAPHEAPQAVVRVSLEDGDGFSSDEDDGWNAAEERNYARTFENIVPMLGAANAGIVEMQDALKNGLQSQEIAKAAQGNDLVAVDATAVSELDSPNDTAKPSEDVGDNDAKQLVGTEQPVLVVHSKNAGSVPEAYRLRVAADRAEIVARHGGSAQSEAAVQAALKWLAANQSSDGRWNPRDHDAGRETNTLGRSRQNAGSQADTGMTGLALLAFLGAGHTHLDGPYRDVVRRGLEYLLESQKSDGNLSGRAATFELMYCHGMATCAISEAYGLTRDERLREAVQKAIGYTIASQDPKGGGWRYKQGDAGDTSQLGWQLMALKSADLAGIPMSETTRRGAIRYLQSVALGRSGGLASYRPREPATQSMTAEALVCWQFLGIDKAHPACREAGEYMMVELPGSGMTNLYYWYYATLGLYQLQDERWQQWNTAIRTTLVQRQIQEGPMAGSWSTDDLWAGYGGRTFTTALATLTLEVYYRFLPIYRDPTNEPLTARRWE